MVLGEIIIALTLFFLITWVFIVFIIYFIPLIIAYIRKHNNIVAIAILNIVLGWIPIGWLAALLWALNSDIKEDEKEDEEED